MQTPFKNTNDIRENINSVFPKIELDKEVAIGNVLYKEDLGVFTFKHASEPVEIEAFFRGIDVGILEHASNNDIKNFYAANYSPSKWWEIKESSLLQLRPLDSLIWMSPYAKAYYMPAFLLESLIGIEALLKQPKEFNSPELLFLFDVIESLMPPESLLNIDIWQKVNEISDLQKNPKNKIGIYTMPNEQRFLIFLSQLNSAKIKTISGYIQFLINRYYQPSNKLGISLEEDITLLEHCWIT